MSDVFKSSAVSSIPRPQIQGTPIVPAGTSNSADSCPTVGGEEGHCTGTVESADGVVSTQGSIEPCIGGVPLSSFSKLIHAKQLREIEAAEDVLRRADLILRYRFRGTCEKSRELIRSVDGASLTGCAVQAYLTDPVSVKPPLLASAVREVHRQFEASYPSHRRGRSRLAAGRRSFPTWTKLAEELRADTVQVSEAGAAKLQGD